MTDSPPLNIVFVCVENACRSQIAEAVAKWYGGSRVNAWSAGSHPRGSVDPRTIEVLRERGITTEGHYSKGISALPTIRWDAVIGMGCGDEACAVLHGAQHLTWNIPAPGGADLTPYRQARDMIEQEIKTLFAALQVTPSV